MKEILTNGEAIKSLYPFGGKYQIWSKSFALMEHFPGYCQFLATAV